MMENSTNFREVYDNYTYIPNVTAIFERNVTGVAHSRDEDLAKIEIILQSVIFFLAVVGNGTVLVSLILKRDSLTRMHLLMLHLSIADLFVAFGSVLPQLAWDITFVFKGGDILCRLVKFMQTLAIYASSYVLVMTAIDRYLAICHPFVSRKYCSKIVKKMVIIAWTLSLLFSIPQMFIFSYKMTPYGMYDCWATFEPAWTMPLYITTFTVLVYIIPTVILMFCYVNICVVVWKSNKVGERLSRLSKRIRTANHCEEINKTPVNHTHAENLAIPEDEYYPRARIHFEAQETPDGVYFTGAKIHSSNLHEPTAIAKFAGRRKSNSGGLTRAKLKTIKLTLTVILCYDICWSPFFIAQMWAAYDETAPFYGAAYTIILLLASLNSCTNPWIYLVFSDSLIHEVKQCFSRITT